MRIKILAAALLVGLLMGCFPFQQTPKIKTDAAVSPDGSKIAFISNADGDFEIYLMSVDGSNVRKLTDNTAYDASPTWSPDGRRLYFSSDRSGEFELYSMNADGSGQQMFDLALPASAE